MTLAELFAKAEIVPAAMRGDAGLTAMTIDSRAASPGALFVCMPGANADSQAFIPAAAEKGAAAALVRDRDGLERAEAAGLAAALIEPNDLADALWRLCDVFFDHPTREMKVVGVTGTNGKTTTAWLLRDMLRAAGLKAAYLGTLGFQTPEEDRELNNTTPFAVELYNLLAEARDRGVEALAIEVSSHALAEKRIDGVEFDAAVFTNLTQDHLDFHGTMEAYEAAKWRLFTDLPKQTEKRFSGAINADDPVGARWLDVLGWDRDMGYSMRPDHGLYGRATNVRVDGLHLELDWMGDAGEAEVPLGGAYNAWNSLSAAAGMCALGWSVEDTAALLPQVRPVPGRFEAVRNDRGIGVLVDYAHTPDALEKLLDAVRPLAKGRIITVFGCGGDRDRTKRPRMALAASERSDLTVITSDNPRTEDPRAIVDDAVPGLAPGREHVEIVDRHEAIRFAIAEAKPGDVVVLAGKGHENYQILGRTKYPFDDRAVAREALS